MSAEEQEVFRLDLDPAPFMEKAARVNQIMEEMRQKGAQRDDISKLERSLMKELEGIAKLNRKYKEQTDGIAAVIKQKEGLGAAMRLVGSQASGMVGDLGSVVGTLLTMNPILIGISVTLAAIGVGSHVFRKMEEGARAAAREMDGLLQKQAELAQQDITLQEKMAGVLERGGGFGQAAGATVRAGGLMGEGFDEDLAIFGASAAALSNRVLLDEQVRLVMAGYLKTGRSAQLMGSREQIQKTIESLIDVGATPEGDAVLSGYLEDRGAINRARAQRPAGEYDTMTPFRRKYEIALQRLKAEQSLTDADVAALRRMRDIDPDTLADFDKLGRTRSAADLFEKLFPEEFGAWDMLVQAGISKSTWRSISDEKLGGGTQTLDELRNLALQASMEAREQGTPRSVVTISVGTLNAAPDRSARPTMFPLSIANKTPLGPTSPAGG